MFGNIIGFLYAIPGVLFALSVHEFSHGYVAYKLGDPTAKNYGRLTLNPIKHLDIFGAIAMLIVGVGWAKPVPVNTRYFKKYKRDTALVAIAGPLSNVLSAFVGTLLYYLIIKFIMTLKPDVFLSPLWSGISEIIVSFIFVNVGLAVFNLIPIPPLDGSRIVDSFLPQKLLVLYHKYERYISLILLLVVVSGFVSPYLQMAINFIVGHIENIVRLIVRI